MPYYSYRNEETGEEIELLQSVHVEHTYVTEGVVWQRIWQAPQIGVPKTDPFSKKQWMEKTDKPGTYGDLWDRSAELSHMRAEKEGREDPVKAQFKKEQDAKDLAIKKARRAEKMKGKKK